MITTEKRAELVKKFGRTANDTGSPEVQVAILTERITNLTPHFAKHKLDNHSKTGLLKMVGSRRRLLRYIKKTRPDAYTKLIGDLGLRK